MNKHKEYYCNLMNYTRVYSETTIKFYQNTRCHISEDRSFHSYHRESLKSYKILRFFSDGMMLLCQWVKGDCSQTHTTPRWCMWEGHTLRTSRILRLSTKRATASSTDSFNPGEKPLVGDRKVGGSHKRSDKSDLVPRRNSQ
jgi:hypothetical protein